MQKLDFSEAVDQICEEDPRFDKEAYFFLRDALDFTVKLRKKTRDVEGSGHVTGQQLLDGIRLYALKQYGPMVVTVLEYWGLKRPFEFGEMVYHLIRIGIFGKTETDSLDDFKGGYDFESAFIAPFRPDRPAKKTRRQAQSDTPAEKLS